MEDIGYLNIKGKTITIADPVARSMAENTANELKASSAKLDKIEDGAQKNTVTSVFGKTGEVTGTKNDVGLENVENISPSDMPVSNAVQQELNRLVVQNAHGNAGQIQFEDGENLQSKYERENWGVSSSVSTIQAAADYNGEALRFLHPAEFTLATDSLDYIVVYNGFLAEFRDSVFFFFTSSRWVGNTAVII